MDGYGRVDGRIMTISTTLNFCFRILMTSHTMFWNFVLMSGMRYLDTKLICKGESVLWTNKCFLHASKFGRDLVHFQCSGKSAPSKSIIIIIISRRN